mgnify:CR=1 FL=1
MIIENNIFKITFFKQENIDQNYLSWINDKKLMQYSSNKKKHDYKSCLEYLKSFNNKDSFFFSVYEKKKDKIIGTTTIYLDQKNQIANLGILIGDINFRRKNYNFKICKALIQYFFKKKNVEKFVIGTRLENISMIKICQKLKMKLFFEEKSNSKIIQHYYLKKKNSKQSIGILLGEPGSKNQILSYLKYNNKLILNSLNYYRKEFKDFKNVKYSDSLRDLIMCSDYIVVGTGHRDYEKRILKKLNKQKNLYIAVIDHFTNIYDRFRVNKKIYLPKKIWVFDKIIFQRLSDKIKKITQLKNNYYLRSFKNLKKRKKKFIVYFAEPVNINKRKKYNQFYDSMKFFLEKIYNLNEFKKYKILIKLHPKQTTKDIEGIVGKEIKKINAKIVNTNLNNLIPSIKYSFGLTTFALILTSRLNIKTFHCKLPLQTSKVINLIKYNKILSFYDYYKSTNK